MNSLDQQNSDWNTKPGENNKSNEGSDTTVSHEKENDSSSHSKEENRRGGRGRGRGGFRGNRGRGKNFTNNESHFSSDNVEIPDNASQNLFVKGINYEATEDDLKETFEKYGEVTSCKILKDKETKKSKGIGFVNYADKKSAVCALNDADNLICKGRNLQVRFAEDKEGEFKGKKSFNNHREENGNNRGGNRGRGRGGFRGNNDNRGRGNRGGNRGRGGFRGGNRNNERNNNRDDWNNNKEDDNNGWGGSNNRERSRSKENDNAW
jgi:RNA recognition motif-containing protein